MAKIEQAFQRRLPIAQLFRNPTIQKLAAFLGEEPEKATLGNGIVQIREGSDQPPLFLLPGAGGNVIYFHALARHLTPGRAVYGLEAPGVDGSRPPLTSVEQIAAHHIELLRPLAGSGPVFLAGHSFGASVALEMSRQLVGSGIPVGLLAIFDSSAPILISDPYWRCWGDTEWLLAICHEVGSFLGAGLDISRQDLDPLDPDARLVFIAERISRRGDWFQGVGPERLRAYLNVYRANCQAEYAPEPVRLDIPITLFRCTESGVRHLDPSPEVAALRQDPSWGWSRFSSRDVSVADVTGTHLTMMLEPHAGELAAKLQTFIDNAANR
jgi:thioesterase domain-containing protein